MKTKLFLVMLITLSLALTGCETFRDGRSQRHASSLVQYLYPKRIEHVDAPTVPVLTLPLRVGIAFVPEDGGRPNAAYTQSPLSEQEKVKLLKEVSDQFRKYPFVKTIEVIPSAYLTPAGSIENLEQMRSMFGVDVIALVSYDQLQFTGTSGFSLAYLTIVGAYVIPAEQNDTRTMVDAAVYDITSRKLLFRAPGLSHIKGSATPINISEKLKHDRENGFREASTNLVANLEVQLSEFRQRVKDAPAEVKIVRSAGYTGGGAVGVPEALAAVVLAAAAFCARRRRQ